KSTSSKDSSTRTRLLVRGGWSVVGGGWWAASPVCDSAPAACRPSPFFFGFERLARATVHLNHTIHGWANESLETAIGPEDLDGVHVRGGTQAEMCSRIIAAAEALARLDQALPAPAAGR